MDNNFNVNEDMYNKAYKEETDKGTELKEVQSEKQSIEFETKVDNGMTSVISVPSLTTSTPVQQQEPEEEPESSCRPDRCQSIRNKFIAPDLQGSPWHRNKTIYLASTIGLLVIWIIVFTTLSQLKLL